MIECEVNGKKIEVDADPNMPLLWALRDELNLTGTKYGCGISQCGACTVHVDGHAIRSCVTPISSVQNKKITTIEGLQSEIAQRVKHAWEKLDVAQCGYCQSGQIMTAVALLTAHHKPTDTQIDQAMTGNICRCGTYSKIREAIHAAAHPEKGA
jgi:isoquinoline 1-oxidoreductase alpha subunit